jgi:uncharacterized membrane protein
MSQINSLDCRRCSESHCREGSSSDGEVLGCESVAWPVRATPLDRGFGTMRKTAVQGAAGAKLVAIAGVIAIAFVLSACGGKPDADGSAATGDAAPTNSAGPASSGPGDRAPDATAQPTAAAGDLDTSGWQLAPPFYAGGEEPFWRLDIIDGWFSFKRSGLPEIEAPMVQPTKANGADVFDSPPLKVVIKREACEAEGSQGDASAQVSFDGVDYGGCAFGGQSSAGSAEAATVIESIALIDACLAKLNEPAIATAIYPREGGRTAVGLRSKDGILYECAVEPSSREIAYLDPIEPRDAKAWMSRMRFLRAGVSDAAKCDGAEEVKAGDTVLGRLLAAKCKF